MQIKFESVQARQVVSSRLRRSFVRLRSKRRLGASLARLVNLVEWKIWKRRKRVCWTKVTVIYNYNLKNVYQTKDIQTWSENLKSVQVWVIEMSYNCALAHCSSKNTAENFDCHVTDVVTVKIIFDKNSISVPLSCLGISSSWMCGADCWPDSVRDRKYLSVGFIFIIGSEVTLIVLRAWLVKIRADFGSAQNIQHVHVEFSQGQNCRS